jgi:hypothetical protein
MKFTAPASHPPKDGLLQQPMTITTLCCWPLRCLLLHVLQQDYGQIAIMHSKGSQLPEMTFEFTTTIFTGNTVVTSSYEGGYWMPLSKVSNTQPNVIGSTWSVTLKQTPYICADGVQGFLLKAGDTAGYCVSSFETVSCGYVHCGT